MANLKIDALEDLAVDAMTEYFRAETPTEIAVQKAHLGLGAFSNVQRRRSAENARFALELMAQRQGQATPLPELSSSLGGSSQSETPG